MGSHKRRKKSNLRAFSRAEISWHFLMTGNKHAHTPSISRYADHVLGMLLF